MKAVPAILLALLFAVELSAQLPYDRIRQAVREPGSWLTYHGSYDAQRFSALDEINRANVQHLRPVWMYQVQGRHHFESTPLVFDGVMYLTDPPSDVVALDVSGGGAVRPSRSPARIRGSTPARRPTWRRLTPAATAC